MDHMNHMNMNHSGDHVNHSMGAAMTAAAVQLTTMTMQAMTTTTADPHAGHHHGHEAMDHSMDGHDMHDMHDMHMGSNDSMPGMDHMMKMYFHLGVTETILFKEWCVHSAGGMVGAVIGVMLLAFLYEGLKFLREQLYRQQYTRLSYSTCAVTGNGMNQQGPAELHKITQTNIFSWPHLLQTCLHMTQVLLSYFLMLIFMTFNVWLCLGVLLGSGVGYFLFGWRKSTIVDISDHCH